MKSVFATFLCLLTFQLAAAIPTQLEINAKSREIYESKAPEALKAAVRELLQKTTIDSQHLIRAAAPMVATYPGPIVADILMYRINMEMERSSPNTGVLRALIEALENVGSVENVDDLVSLREIADDKLEGKGTGERTKTITAFERAEAVLLTRPRATPQTGPTAAPPDLTGDIVKLITGLLERSKAETSAALPGSPTAKPATTMVAQSARVTTAPLPPEARIPLFMELVQRKNNEEFTKMANKFGRMVKRNFYDNEAKARNSGREPIVFEGREKEVRQMSEAFGKLEKAHVLMTGKAGVGKTTLERILMSRWFSGEASFPGNNIPLVFEINILTIVAANPSELLALVDMAQMIAHELDRDVILVADEAHVSHEMARHALKGFLTELNNDDNSRVHMDWKTTSGEAREFMDDSAFVRRWTEIKVPEFDKEQTIRSIKNTFFPQWREKHQQDGWKFESVEEGALEYAYRNGHLEQAFAGNPTASKELVEGAIKHKLETLVRAHASGEDATPPGPFTISTTDVQDYLRFQKGMKLVAGSPTFDADFEELWGTFAAEYRGNEGFKEQLKSRLKTFFGTPQKQMMEALLFLGAPGGGKTFAAEQLAKIFFDGAILRLNGADYKEAHAKSRATGSPPGYVGYKERTSVFTKFFADYPNGGVIKIEEADYLNQDMIQMLVNMISDKEFIDPHGHSWNTSQYLLIMNTNMGQEYLVPPDSKQLMTWEQYAARRLALTEKTILNGREMEIVNPKKIDQAFDRFITKIVTQSNPTDDTSMVSQEAIKQKRRYHAMYVLSPNRDELLDAGRVKWASYAKMAQDDFGVTFVLEDGVLDRILDIDSYKFEKGYSYVLDQITDKLSQNLQGYLSQKGKTVHVALEDVTVEINSVPIPSQNLVVTMDDSEERYSLEAHMPRGDNLWAANEDMRARVADFDVNMAKYVKGNGDMFARIKAKLQLKLIDWNTRLVFTLLGTSGNGKTESAKAIAKGLFGDENAMFSISGINHVMQLNDYLRPPSGYVGGNDRTEFEAWFESQRHAGGGVILLDELLSFSGMTKIEVAEKIQVINRFYDFLDEGYLRIGTRREDARAFVVVITGNALQELFDHIEDVPDAQKLVQKVLKHTSEADVLKYFKQLGLDAPKIARLGEIFIRGPLSKESALDVGRKMLKKAIDEKIAMSLREQRRGSAVPSIRVEPLLLESIVDKVKTVRLGMRKVNSAIQRLIAEPTAGILFFFPTAGEIYVQNTDAGMRWTVDGEAVVLVEQKGEGDEGPRNLWVKLADKLTADKIVTPELKDIEEPPKTKLSAIEVEHTAIHEVIGHWMTSVLLNGRNAHEVISIIPSAGALGFVRQIREEEYTSDSLTSMLKFAVYLEAGHRSLFVRNVYGTGGGSSGKAKEKGRNDDLGKVDGLFERMMSNNLVSATVEFDKASDKIEFKSLMRGPLKEMTDRVIRYGLKLGYFEKILQIAAKDRFLEQDMLDAYVADLKKENKLQDPDLVFLFFLDQVFSEEIAKPETKAKAKVIYGEVLERSLREVLQLRRDKGTLTENLKTWVDEALARHAFTKPVAELSCEFLLTIEKPVAK